MNMKWPKTITAGVALLAAVGSSAHSQAQPAAPAKSSPAPARPVDSPDPAVHSITLPNVPTELPPGPASGRDVVGTTCTACHSVRNILNQPAFPRQTWVNEVNKMRTNYGAPVAEQQIPAIVDYLVSIRGAPEPKTQP